ncbi:protein FAM169B-like isoform X2 [Nycticebus coucang]|uniref:protein FAM169B-like isoform X2 n=1 Tax=Nycticebus coucang TaxID=9470 RepID=UPI00234C21E7|nr:protein FAM169B-like isoform X2 [Nycticebus coucang]
MREPSSEVEGVEGDPDVLGGATRRGGSGGVEAEAEAGQGAAGIYPVDILEDDPEGYQEAALAYYTSLGKGARTSPEIFSLPTGEQVKLEASSVCFCTMYRDEPQHKILVLVNPQVTKTVVAVYIKKSWWFTEEVLRTSDPVREGLLKVQSFGERIVLFVLNVIIFGRLERNLDDDDMFFLPHSVKEQAKILWRRGAAVGFYTTKMTGSLCGDGTGACYLLPVFDTVFVRRKHRRQGLAMAMLRDFCETFPEDEALGISCPISPAMYRVCRRFLRAWPEERGRLWEVETPGAWGQRSNIWLKVQLQQAGLPDSYPGNSKEEEVGVNGHGQTSQGNRPRQSANGEGNKERTCGEELESSNNGQDLGVKEEEAGLPERACWAELEVQEAKRTAEEAGLDGDPWHKLPQPSP